MKSRSIDPKKPRSALVFVAKCCVLLIVLIFVGQTIARTLAELKKHQSLFDATKMDFGLLAIGIAINWVGMLPAGIGWLRSLIALDQVVPTIQGLYAYYLGHLGKYVPGKAMALILRVGALHPSGVEIKPTIVSIFIETLTSMCTGAILGGIFLLSLSPPRWMYYIALSLIPIAIAFLLPQLFRSILRMVAKSRIGQMPPAVSDAITSRLMLSTCAWMTLGWLLNGTGAWFVLNGLQSDSVQWTLLAWMACVSAVSLGAVAGFGSMIPGGAVVRELVITWLLACVVSEPLALVAALIFRIVSLSGEFTYVALLGVLRR